MSKAIIYHNPRCRKSRETLAILEQKGLEVEIIEYLKDTPSVKDLEKLTQMLGIKPEQLIRKGEKIYKEQFKAGKYTDEEWLNIMVKNPILIERPIVVHNHQAVIGRPPENVENIL